MRNPAQGGCLADREPIKPSNAQEGTSLKPPPNIKLIFPEGWSTAEGFRDPEYETITKKERLLAWIAPPHLPISTRELELSARDAGEAPPEAYEAQSKESPPPPNAEAPTSPPLAGGSARDAGEAPPEAHEAQSKESPPPPNAEAPTSPPLAGGSARDAGEAPPEAYEAHEGHALDGTIGSSMPDLRASSMSTISSSISKSFSRDAGEAPPEALEAANSAGLDDGSPALGRIFYAFFKQHPPGPPENYTHEFVKRMGEIHEALSKSGWSKADMAERFSATGFKLPAAFARLSYFNLALDWLYDPMHEIMNLGNRLATTLLGLDFNEAARNFAEEEGLHPEWGQTEWVQNSKALAFLKELRGVTRWGDGHKHLLRTSTASNGAKYAKHLKAHAALKAFESKLLAVLSSWPRDDGEVDNALQDIVSKLTITIRECTAHSIEPQDMEYLREQTRLFFEDLEANGPPQWLAINTHKIWHWADLLLRFGPVREWWMYAFESMNGKLARWVKNNAFPVASIMNGYLRLKTLRSLRGILTMLLNRERATAGRVPRALMAGPAPGIVVTTFGDKGKPLELTSLEIDQLTRWMRASIPAYRKLFQQHAEYDLFRRRENAARSKHANRYRQEVGGVPAIAFGPLEDPEGWLGRQYMAYEKSLMMGPEPMCSKYNKVNIGGVFYRTRDGDKGKVTTQCFVRASFPKNDADADDEWEDRYGIINAILRVSIGGVLYTFLKCDWLPVPTEAQIASFKLKNSILGVDKVSTHGTPPSTLWTTESPTYWPIKSKRK
ncbi:hypothetical protein CYMTET_54049 [Cymbomonas tetramitiformis]|uniref:Uncharacterized protein n=1 Tax=Cymbomonas tetramitiformis TaxID=36881 RepID=A0AAE0BGZ7_9CHLO|nr:hypothetical protein CYMTET_54049 [Cymbomonas tetramitiformis]